MAIEGDIAVTLEWDGRCVTGVGVRSSRPFAASRVLVGRDPASAAAMAPRLFSICAQAQRAAAAAAIGAADTGAPDATAIGSLERRVILETVQEYLWRLLIDLPKAMGGEPVFAPVGLARAAIVDDLAEAHPTRGERLTVARAVDRVVAAHVLGMPASRWLAIDSVTALEKALDAARTVPLVLLAQLLRSAPSLAASDTDLMPSASDAALRDALAPPLESDAAFVREPHWNGRPAETGTLARMQAHPCVAALAARHGRSVATRVAARLFELAQIATRIAEDADEFGWVRALPLADGVGLAAVQTARGLLLHRAEVRDDLVRDYRIVAPTEWNFHPRGPLARGLQGHSAPDEASLVRDARLAVQALDPCVGCRLEVAHA